MRQNYWLFLGTLFTLLLVAIAPQARANALTSVDTGYTISKVSYANIAGNNYIGASSYEGVILCLDGDGELLWKSPLSGFMNHDILVSQAVETTSPVIFAANADGSLYCIGDRGETLWSFRANDAPMYSVTTLESDGVKYVVCGSFDGNIYYLRADSGDMVKCIESESYSQERSWGDEIHPKNGSHSINFVRSVKDEAGNDMLAVHAIVHQNTGHGGLYMFKALEDMPFKRIEEVTKAPFGDFTTSLGTVSQDIIMGGSSMIDAAKIARINPLTGSETTYDIRKLGGNRLDSFGYRVVQTEVIPTEKSFYYFVLFGSRVLLMPESPTYESVEVLKCRYSFNDIAYNSAQNRIILASSQSGGSCIHILDLNDSDWRRSYEELQPTGKIAKLLANRELMGEQIAKFKAPKWERQPLEVYFMSENKTNSDARDVINSIESGYKSPMFLNNKFFADKPKWDRSNFGNEFYANRRDQRNRYTLTEDEAFSLTSPLFDNQPGIAYWGGHGNDPLLFSLDLQRRIAEASQGKKIVWIYPELELFDENFTYVMDNHIYPLADIAAQHNANIYVRTKHLFWQSVAYLPLWSRLMSGEYADVFIPAMEETTDKSMDLSIAARLGVWSSGAVNSWGSRCARDNPSFDRMRQFSHQMLPNHFLRMMIFHLSYGAQYIDNFPVDQRYMSVLWELIAKGAIYIPKREEIVSFSPVRLSMLEPDAVYLNEGNNSKWTGFYDEAHENENKMVFSRINGTWPGAPVTEWDFSNYAAGVKDRHLNFLAPYSNGMVMIAPPTDAGAPRGDLLDHIHPIYRDIAQEFFTDGHYYYNTSEKERPLAADQYYPKVERAIAESSTKIPITVGGDNVAWVAAQSAKRHIRLTLIDGGYLNPNDRVAKVQFNTVEPTRVVDIMSGESFDVSTSGECQIDIPCGGFRFIDVEIQENL